MYIQFTKDINKIRNTVVFGLTIRELIILGASGGLCFILYQILSNFLPIVLSIYAVIPIIVISAFVVFFNPNGMNFEKFIFYKLKRIFFSKNIRTYQTENLYEKIESEIKKEEEQRNVSISGQKNQKRKPVKKYAAQNSSAKHTLP